MASLIRAVTLPELPEEKPERRHPWMARMELRKVRFGGFRPHVPVRKRPEHYSY